MMHKKIVMVVDKTMPQESLYAALEGEYQVIPAADAQAALMQLRCGASLLLVAPMPVGEVCALLEQMERELCALPVMVALEGCSEADAAQLLAHGVADVICLPCYPQVFLHRVNQAVQLWEARSLMRPYQRDQLTGLSSRPAVEQHGTMDDEKLHARHIREQSMAASMESALEEGQFRVYFQPQYSLQDECMTGAEALVRWEHPDWGLLSPSEFLPLFEEKGFTPRLDAYVWENVCAMMKGWREKGYPTLPVSVNVSRADLHQSDLLQTLQTLTESYGVNPSSLHLEIMESICVQNAGQVADTLAGLRKLGFIIEMDRFGGGCLPLPMLRHMKLDGLKLDMGFLRDETEKPVEQSILNDLINMAHRMGLSVAAQGVESRHQVERLRATNCDDVQGYFFARPMPAEALETLWQSQCRQAERRSQEDWRAEDREQCILVVDESPAYRESVKNTFKDAYHVVEASDAAGALTVLEHREHRKISAIILSITLPDGGAEKLLAALHQEPASWRIPVLSTIPQCDVEVDMPLALETDDFLCKCHPMFDLHRRVVRLMDIAALQARENVLEHAASRDYLTGLFNRRGLQAALNTMHDERLPLAVCLFDLDNLKSVNDTYGHDMGDKVICGFARILCRYTRTTDIQCRYGGDEFIVILKNLSDPALARRKVDDISRAFCEEMAKEGLPSSCSAGIAMCMTGEKAAVDVIKRADEALYCAKREHKGGCCLYHDEDCVTEVHHDDSDE